MKARDGAILVLWAFCLAVVLRGGGSVLPFDKPSATAATYVYEKDDTAPPSAVLAALDKLNRDGITATIYDDDTLDGDGDTPDQYKASLIAANEHGKPALVVTARNGNEVLKVVKAPTTETEVLEAVK